MKRILWFLMASLAFLTTSHAQYEKTMKMDTNYVIVDFNKIAPSNNIATNAATCLYSGSYSNVQAALDALLYTAPTVTLSGGSTYDVGRVVTNIALTFTCNKTMTSRTITGGGTNVSLGAGGSGSYTLTNALKSTQTTYTATVTDGTSTNTGTTTLYFYNRKYWGFNDVTNSISDSQIKLLGTNQLTTTKVIGPENLTPSGTNYIWVCYPASFGAATFKLNGLPSTSWLIETNDFVNDYGYTNSYLRHRSPNKYSVTMTLEVD